MGWGLLGDPCQSLYRLASELGREAAGSGPKLPSRLSSAISASDSRDRKVGQFGICHGYFQHPHLYYSFVHSQAGWNPSLPAVEGYTCYLWSPHGGWGWAQGPRRALWASTQKLRQGRAIFLEEPEWVVDSWGLCPVATALGQCTCLAEAGTTLGKDRRYRLSFPREGGWEPKR